jgi:hypothetical protein
MKRRTHFAIAVVLATSAACADRTSRDAADSARVVADGRVGRDYDFDTLDVPGSLTTVAADITDRGVVVGWFEQDSVVRGFVHDRGAFTPVTYPGASLTRVTSMAADGSLAGAYRMRSESKVAWHGFVRRPSGEFLEVKHPDHPHGMAQRILDDGTILGCYHGDDYTTSMRGIVVKEGRISVSDLPASMHSGASPDGRRVVGLLSSDGRAYLIEGERVTYLEAPGSSATEAWDVNGAGLVVGAAIDSAKRASSVLFSSGVWTPLEVPGARTSVAFGINARGDVVGGWEDSLGRRRAFVARRRGQ